MSAVESIQGGGLSPDDREVVAHGKEARGANVWEDMPEVLRYWRAEIKLMERMTERFREVMFDAGFKLSRWYGPGALASYVIRTKGLKDHIQNHPFESAVHQIGRASCRDRGVPSV